MSMNRIKKIEILWSLLFAMCCVLSMNASAEVVFDGTVVQAAHLQDRFTILMQHSVLKQATIYSTVLIPSM